MELPEKGSGWTTGDYVIYGLDKSIGIANIINKIKKRACEIVINKI